MACLTTLKHSLTSTPATLAFAVVTVAVLVGIRFYLGRQKYPDAPTLRISERPGSLGVLDDMTRVVTDMGGMLQIGWEQYSKHNINYILNTFSGKRFVVAPKYFEEIRRAPDTHVSNLASNNELMQLGHTLHKRLMVDQYHFDIPIRKSLTQSLGPKLPDIVEEAKLSLQQYIGESKDWTPHHMHDLAFDLVTRTANRLLFGPELARNEEFQKLSIDYTTIMFGGADMIRNYWGILKPIVMWLKTDIYRAQALARQHLVPLLKARIALEDRYVAEGRQAEWQKVKADDTIQWVLDVTPPEERDPYRLVYRMLHINIAAVHTSSVTFMDTFHCLSVLPEVQRELREEIEQVFRREGGWTKQTLTYLVKMDSFMTESMRLCVHSGVKMGRKTIKDWELSDGTKLPKGTYLFVNHLPLVLDQSSFDHPLDFDPWRMYKLRRKEGQANQHQFVMTSQTNLTFGHGKHACPGRFFAANEIKVLLALIIMKYEFRAVNLPGGLKDIIPGRWYNFSRSPISHAIIEFRDRSNEISADLKPIFTDI
ncbi:Cytochrome P450 [Pleurostoma richardsiae]|uniref:Cytochrome P450 n=1 Tax=Pleurostoma richardsiae TaxID=41990 RepID=A0AA38S0P8_9PEZI|nr:Cytochrome P450 [Pleurostoma richardsiae]